jgi:putative flippase GtrA
VKALISDVFSWKFVKYFIVGVLGVSLDFAILYTLVEYGHLHYLLGATIAVSIVLWISFTLNKFWTFRNLEKKYFHQFAKYIIAHAFAMAVNLILLTFFVEIVHLWYIHGKIFATTVSAIINFLLTRKYVFSGRSNA